MAAYNAKKNTEKATEKLNTLCNSLSIKPDTEDHKRVSELIKENKTDEEIKTIMTDETKKMVFFNQLENAKNKVDKPKPSATMLTKEDRIELNKIKREY
jgi:hypothetical protein